MGVGFIDPEPAEKVRPPRKQVLVVVTASWQVLCFDHNLALMWEVAIEESLPPNARLAEVRGDALACQGHRCRCAVQAPGFCAFRAVEGEPFPGWAGALLTLHAMHSCLGLERQRGLCH